MRKLGLKSNERKKVQELVDFNKNKDKESYSFIQMNINIIRSNNLKHYLLQRPNLLHLKLWALKNQYQPSSQKQNGPA